MNTSLAPETLADPTAYQHRLKRVLGTYSLEKPGPLLVCIGGMHGNEPAGVKAFLNVYDYLMEHNVFMHGKVVGLSGNLGALKVGKRFLKKDFNREWTAHNILSIQHDRDTREYPEAKEQHALLKEIRELLRYEDGPIYFIDLHTTSSKSQPYVTINDTLRNRKLGTQYPLPLVLGIEEYLVGTALSFINQLGPVAIGFEGGQHDDPVAVDNLEAIIWLSLQNVGCLSKQHIPNRNHYMELLNRQAADKEHVFEVRYRHDVRGLRHFKMLKGFTNFQSVHKLELLASDEVGLIYAPEAGRIFMPLYQKQGDDGFFIIRPIKKFWLEVSAFLRKTRFHQFLHFLPGVSRYNGLAYTIVVNSHIAKWYVKDFFHLMGFRINRQEGKYMIFIKREFDVKGPKEYNGTQTVFADHRR